MTLAKKHSADLSPQSIKKSVLSSAIQQPFTVYPAAIAAVSGTYLLAFGSSFAALAALSVSGTFALGNWAFQYFARGSAHADRFVRAYQAELTQARKNALEKLSTDLSSVNSTQGMKQIELFEEKFENFKVILSKKLEPEEITYSRYMSIAEQVFLAGLDNLESAALAKQSVSAMDVDYIESELERLANTSESREITQREQLSARLELYNEQNELAKRLTSENEEALTQLDQVTAKISTIKTRQGHAKFELEEAVSELRYLVERSAKYSNEH